ncbi:MAG: DNA mismatch repair endonuclease MutL [Clostridia bacterium]|nr:DNA mismatch repair endonuclease MutL [Clostridia bacterium]
MGNIVLLDELTINQIAAGEVLDRPANAVKELVENSIDAGSKHITIEIKNGGKELIKVTDDGSGIKKDDLLISFERHATSKIRKVEDLENTYTMGFRGEALASIVAVSKVTMVTKTAEDELGSKVVAESGEVLKVEEVSCNTGTSISVNELFFNTPVRYKFLKQDFTEFRYIREWVEKTAMANLDISFKLINEGKIVFSSNGNGNIHDIVYAIYGKQTEEKIVDVDFKEDDIRITGIVGNTLLADKTRKNQIIFLNKRNIKDKIVENAADQAFNANIGIGKKGFFIINIEMPAGEYDVNVHPTKNEVRFKDESKIYKVVYSALKSSLLSKEFLGDNSQEQLESKINYINNEFGFLTNHFGNKKDNYSEKMKADIELIHRETDRKIEYKFVGILFKTYIIIELDNQMYLIDQHAAHERILYEQIRANYKDNLKNNSQMTLIPELINLTHKEFEFVKENLELFQNIGFELEPFGDNTVKVSGFPDIEYRKKINNREMFLDILDEMTGNAKSNFKTVEERFIATVACKAAVKAGMDLTAEEVDTLIQRLLKLQNPYTCPHGRPTTVKFNKNEILSL